MRPATPCADRLRIAWRILFLERCEDGVTTYHTMPVEAIDEVADIIPDGGEAPSSPRCGRSFRLQTRLDDQRCSSPPYPLPWTISKNR